MPLDITQLLRTAPSVKIVIGEVTISLGKVLAIEVPESSASEPNRFQLAQNQWHLRYQGVEIEKKGSIGYHYIHQLLSRPNEYFPVTKMVTQVYGEPLEEVANSETATLGLNEQSDLAEEILPDDKRKVLEKYLEGAKSEYQQLKAAGDYEGAENKAEEIEKIEVYLRQHRFGAHNRRFGSREDKNRKSVSTAIGRAIDDIAKVHPALARHLDNSIYTGKECGYRPETQVTWIL